MDGSSKVKREIDTLKLGNVNENGNGNDNKKLKKLKQESELKIANLQQENELLKLQITFVKEKVEELEKLIVG